jgi:membrane protein YqaA with SNARE-associated domain
MREMKQQAISNWALHRRLYEWVLGFASKPVAPFVLFVIAFIEAFVPFVPPDALLVPMCLERRRRSIFFALIATVGSVVGAMIGYFVIASLIAGGAEWILSESRMEELIVKFSEHGNMYVFIAAVTVVPFFALTTVAGVAELDILQFLLVCIAGRFLRYGIEAAIIMWMGKDAKEFIEKRFNVISIVVCALALIFVYGITKWL